MTITNDMRATLLRKLQTGGLHHLGWDKHRRLTDAGAELALTVWRWVEYHAAILVVFLVFDAPGPAMLLATGCWLDTAWHWRQARQEIDQIIRS